VFHNTFQLVGFAHDAYHSIAREGTLGEYFGEPLANLLKIAQHGLSTPAIGSGNEDKLRTQVTADGLRFGLGHKLEPCTY
jgi:hypothetical protein